MRFPLFMVLLFSVSAAATQANLKSHDSTQAGVRDLPSASLSEAQLKSVDHLFRQRKMDGCEGADLDELIRGLGFETIPTTTHQNVVLVDPSAGCARSGQGANADMWIIRFHGDRAVFVPTPDDFSGWLFSVGPSVRHGYPDIVLGWHLGGADTAISCFRFDGKSYYTRKTQNCFPTATTTGRSRQRTK